MAKTRSPLAVTSVGGSLNKVVGALIGIAMLWLVVKFPSDAAGWVTHVGHLAVTVIDAVASFLRDVAG